jgi:type IV secretion system protein VirB6
MHVFIRRIYPTDLNMQELRNAIEVRNEESQCLGSLAIGQGFANSGELARVSLPCRTKNSVLSLTSIIIRKLLIIGFLSLFLAIDLAPSAQAFDGLIDFENYSQGKTGSSYIGQYFTQSRIGQCLSSLVKITDIHHLNNNFLPPVIGEGLIAPPTPPLVRNLLITSGAALGATAVATAIMPLAGVGLAAILAAAQALQMIDVCVNVYPIQPHEYYNRDVLGLGCVETFPTNFVDANNKQQINHPDMPYYFTCDQNYNPNISSFIVDGVNYGIGWGYNKKLCEGKAGVNYKNFEHLVGKIRVEAFPGVDRIFYNVNNCSGWGFFSCAVNAVTLNSDPYKPCTMNKRQFVELYAGEIKKVPKTNIYVYAYLKFDLTKTLISYPSINNESNDHIPQIQLCAIGYVGFTPNVPSMWPVELGCTSVVPAKDLSIMVKELSEYAKDTRCYYISAGRVDLNSLGSALMPSDLMGKNGIAMKKFLQSDFHIFSTYVGCVQDALNKYILRPLDEVSNTSTSGSFFELVQESMRGMVFALLTLAVSLFAIKIISSAQPLKNSDYLMWILKFALVVSFSTGSIWYSTQNSQPTIYSAVINASSEIGKFFMNFPQLNDPIGHCSYDYQGQLLAERVVTSSPNGGPISPTIGFNGVKLTVWDYIDCKIINYFNLGACDYDGASILFSFFIGLFGNFFYGGPLIFIASFLFSFMLTALVVRFAFITIVSLVVLTILVLFSPLFICMLLFEQTKGFFKGWFDIIIGYMLYPGLLFAFMALMLASFDAVFYGDIKDISNVQNFIEYCKEKNSVYCTTVLVLEKNGCTNNNATVNQMREAITEKPAWLLGLRAVKPSILYMYFFQMLELTLLVTLFWLLHNSMLSFLATLLSVPEPSFGMPFGGVTNIGMAKMSYTTAKGAAGLASRVGRFFRGG